MSTTSREAPSTTARDALGSADPPRTGLKTQATSDRLYRIIWRWHFYAGMLITLPLIVVAVTGAIYIFKDELEGVLYPGVTYVEPAAERVSYERQVAAAQAALPSPARIGLVQVFADPQRATSIALFGTKIQYSYVDPYRGKYLGAITQGGFFDIVLQ